MRDVITGDQLKCLTLLFPPLLPLSLLSARRRVRLGRLCPSKISSFRGRRVKVGRWKMDGCGRMKEESFVAACSGRSEGHNTGIGLASVQESVKLSLASAGVIDVPGMSLAYMVIRRAVVATYLGTWVGENHHLRLHHSVNATRPAPSHRYRGTSTDGKKLACTIIELDGLVS